jgi:hypothetical protein
MGRFDYANGCTRVEIAGTDKDAKPESFVFDIQQVTWAEKWMEGYEPVKPMTAGLPLTKAGHHSVKVGGPRSAPAQRKDPIR